MAADKSSRATKFRKNREARGFKSISVTISPEAKKALETLQVTREWTQWEAVSEALVYAAEHLAGFVRPEAAQEAETVTPGTQSAERARETGELLEMKKLILGFEERMGELERRLRKAGESPVGNAATHAPSESRTSAEPKRASVDHAADRSGKKQRDPVSRTLDVQSGGDQTSDEPAPDVRIHDAGAHSASSTGTDTPRAADGEPGSRRQGEPHAGAQTATQAHAGASKSVSQPAEDGQQAPASSSTLSGPDEDAILDFAAHAFREHGMTISRGRTYRMAKQQGIRVHDSEEEYGRFLQANLAEISRRLKELMSAG